MEHPNGEISYAVDIQSLELGGEICAFHICINFVLSIFWFLKYIFSHTYTSRILLDFEKTGMRQ